MEARASYQEKKRRLKASYGLSEIYKDIKQRRGIFIEVTFFRGIWRHKINIEVSE